MDYFRVMIPVPKITSQRKNIFPTFPLYAQPHHHRYPHMVSMMRGRRGDQPLYTQAKGCKIRTIKNGLVQAIDECAANVIRDFTPVASKAARRVQVGQRRRQIDLEKNTV